MLGLGPDAYNKAIGLYKNPWLKPLEFLLVAAVLYHAGNGLMVMILDLWPAATRFYRRMFWIGAGVYAAAMVGVAVVMLGKLVGLR